MTIVEDSDDDSVLSENEYEKASSVGTENEDNIHYFYRENTFNLNNNPNNQPDNLTNHRERLKKHREFIKTIRLKTETPENRFHWVHAFKTVAGTEKLYSNVLYY